jgi:hypothetical protein
VFDLEGDDRQGFSCTAVRAAALEMLANPAL